jgi:hypothetical protein
LAGRASGILPECQWEGAGALGIDLKLVIGNLKLEIRGEGERFPTSGTAPPPPPAPSPGYPFPLCRGRRVEQSQSKEEGRLLEASISQISQRADVVEGRNFGVIVYRSFCRWGWRARRPFPEFEVAQDSLDDGGAVDQADDFKRAAATRANQRIRFVRVKKRSKTYAEIFECGSGFTLGIDVPRCLLTTNL